MRRIMGAKKYTSVAYKPVLQDKGRSDGLRANHPGMPAARETAIEGLNRGAPR